MLHSKDMEWQIKLKKKKRKEKKELTTCCLQETHFMEKDTDRLKVRGGKRYFMQTGITKNRGYHIHIDKIYYI